MKKVKSSFDSLNKEEQKKRIESYKRAGEFLKKKKEENRKESK